MGQGIVQGNRAPGDSALPRTYSRPSPPGRGLRGLLLAKHHRALFQLPSFYQHHPTCRREGLQRVGHTQRVMWKKPVRVIALVHTSPRIIICTTMWRALTLTGRHHDGQRHQKEHEAVSTRVPLLSREQQHQPRNAVGRYNMHVGMGQER